MAEHLHKTVDELLLGRPSPFTSLEALYWRAYLKQKRKYEKEAEKKAGNKPSGSAPPKMMGRT